MRDRPDNVLFILNALAGSDNPLSCSQLADRHPTYRPEQIYAVMSGMGAAGRRWWIRPVGQWSRSGGFQITTEGLREMRRRAIHGPSPRRRKQKKPRQSRVCPCCNQPLMRRR